MLRFTHREPIGSSTFLMPVDPVDFVRTLGALESSVPAIRPETRDVFDMPKNRLKKLIQGFIWRDEHFKGATLKSIAIRENCSEGYVSQAIFGTFDFTAAA